MGYVCKQAQGTQAEYCPDIPWVSRASRVEEQAPSTFLNVGQVPGFMGRKLPLLWALQSGAELNTALGGLFVSRMTGSVLKSHENARITPA